MRNVIVIGAGAVGAAGVAMAFVGQGVARADALSDVTGKYYGQAKSVLSQAGLTPIVATRVGDATTDDGCVIDRIQPAAGAGGPGSKTVYVYLNCYANVASPRQPGYSRQSPLGKAAYDAQQQAVAQQQQQAQQQGQQQASLQAQQSAEQLQQSQSEQSITASNPH